jgi:DNA sulfur modification protein DndD
MKLNRIVLENYGPYKGRNEFSLPTSEEAPIVLFGGTNGAGKTTLFNAIQVCLHGRSAFDDRLSRSEYEDWLRNKIHASGGTDLTEATLRVDFEYSDLDDTSQYAVTRSIRDRGRSVVDDLTVTRNGQPLSDVDADQWDDFLKELIPPGISQLFFFDGEKVQRLAEEIKAQDNFAASLKSLLGLDLVDRLDSDLSIYLSNKLDEGGNDELAEKVETLREEISEIEDRQATLREKIEGKQRRIEELTEQIEQKERELSQEGGAYADKRDEYKEQRAQLEARQEMLREQIRELATDCYPFSLAPDLCREVVEQLEAEREREQDRAAQERAAELFDELTADEDLLNGADIDPDSAETVVSRIEAEFQARLSATNTDSYTLASEFSRREQQEMEVVVDQALNEVPGELGQLTRELEQKTKERQEIETKLRRAPEQSTIQPVVTKIQDLTETRSELKRDIEDHQEELEELETRLGKKQVSLENRLEDREKLGSVSERAALASDVRSVVQEYREELVKEKLTKLETALSERYLQLTNKPGLYERVHINTDPIAISIETNGGARKSQSRLSAGERQIFATALLWALADISGRPLPFMIDTPLARLDQEHRGNLVKEFFPKAAHQVLIFSTDTEITRERYEQLRDDLAAEYYLEAHETEGRTKVSPGYFWTDPEDAVQGQGTGGIMNGNYEAQAKIQGFSHE